jgi:hypothetical protein
MIYNAFSKYSLISQAVNGANLNLLWGDVFIAPGAELASDLIYSHSQRVLSPSKSRLCSFCDAGVTIMMR